MKVRIFCLLIFFVQFVQSQQIVGNDYKLKGVVELGAEGFNSFIIKLDAKKNWNLVKAQFGQSYLMEESANASIIDQLEDYILQLIQSDIHPYDIHFIVSSGASNQSSTKTVLKELKSKGYIVNMVSTEKEGQLAFKSVIPDSQRNKSMVIDVGSSNTKISWYVDGTVKSLSTYGSKFFKDNVADSTVYKDLQSVASKMPKNRTETVYLIGGMPYRYAKRTRKGNERYTELSPINSYDPKDEKERCGSMILSELQKEGNIKKYVFDWDSNFSIGFLLELPY